MESDVVGPLAVQPLPVALALFNQHHEGHAGDRLGHRIDAKERVVAQRPVAPDIHAAERGAVHHLAVTRHQQLRESRWL